jgi:hypothetical protein
MEFELNLELQLNYRLKCYGWSSRLGCGLELQVDFELLFDVLRMELQVDVDLKM